MSFGDAPVLVGVVTQPEPAPDPERPAFLFLNAGMLHRVGPSRVHVRLASALADEGFTTLRFDFSGIGDSELSREGGSFLERSGREVGRAMDHLERTLETQSFVLLGLCSGAEVAHHTAVNDTRVVGIVPMDGHLYPTWRYYVHRYGPRLMRARSWQNLLSGRTHVVPFLQRLFGTDAAEGDAARQGSAIFRRDRPPKAEVAAELRALVDREVRQLQIFTGGLEELCTYGGQFRDTFRSLDFDGLLTEVFLPDADHTFTSLEQQQRLVEVVRRWAREGWSARDERAYVGARVEGEAHRGSEPERDAPERDEEG